MPADRKVNVSRLTSGNSANFAAEQADQQFGHRSKEVAAMISGKNARGLLMDIECQLRRLPPDGSKNHKQTNVAAQIFRARIGLGKLDDVVTVAELEGQNNAAYGAIIMAARESIDVFNIRV